MFETYNPISLSIYGESHGEKIGMKLTGIKPDIRIDLDRLQAYVDRRKSSSAAYSTKRFEPDLLEIVGGLKNGITTGEDIIIEIRNTQAKSADYSNLKYVPRPSHADYPAFIKFGGKLDMRGGGKFSGRLTAPMVIAGGIAAQILESYKINTYAYISEIAGIKSASYKDNRIEEKDLITLKNEKFPLLNTNVKSDIEAAIENAVKSCDSLGGVIEILTFNLSVGLGDSMFDSLESKISSILFAIPAVKGVEFGLGFDISKLKGSEANDCYYFDCDSNVKTYTNNNGGILGGMSNGMPLMCRIAIKPTPSISKPQKSINLETHENVELIIEGRHDACIVPRAVVVAEAAVNIAILTAL